MEEFRDNYKQQAIDFLHSQIVNMIQHGGKRGIFVDEILRGIDSRDIHVYLNSLVRRQNLPFKNPTVQSILIKDSETFSMLCDYVDVYKIREYLPREQRLYFIETGDFAITVIPIEFENEQVAINIEPLDYSPPFIRDIYEGKGKLSMDKIPFVKYDKDGNRIE